MPIQTEAVADAPDEVTAAPGESADAPKPKKNPRIPYIESDEAKPCLGEPKTYKAKGEEITRQRLVKIPEGFDPAKHLSPRKADFEPDAEPFYWDFKLAEAERQVTYCREQAADARDTGKRERKAKMKKLEAMKARYAEMLASVASETGMSEDDLLASLGASA